MAWLPPSSWPGPASPWRCERRLPSPAGPRGRPSSPCPGSCMIWDPRSTPSPWRHPSSPPCPWRNPDCTGFGLRRSWPIRWTMERQSCWNVIWGTRPASWEMTRRPTVASTVRYWPTGRAFATICSSPLLAGLAIRSPWPVSVCWDCAPHVPSPRAISKDLGLALSLRAWAHIHFCLWSHPSRPPLGWC